MAQVSRLRAALIGSALGTGLGLLVVAPFIESFAPEQGARHEHHCHQVTHTGPCAVAAQELDVHGGREAQQIHEAIVAACPGGVSIQERPE